MKEEPLRSLAMEWTLYMRKNAKCRLDYLVRTGQFKRRVHWV